MVADQDTDRTERAVRTWISKHPGCSREAVAAGVGVSVERVSEVLGSDAGLLLIETRARVPEFSDEEVIRCLQRAAATLGSPLAVSKYDAVNTSGPSSARIIQRFGSWNAGCEAAGLAVNKGRLSYSRGWTRQSVLEAVADYLASEKPTGSYADYTAWARRTPGAPSGQTLRNYVGAWSSAKAEAMVVLAQRQG